MTKPRHRYRELLAPMMVVPLLLLASCGGGEDEPASEPITETDQGSAASDANGADSDDDQQVVCNLLSDEEVTEVTGFEVLAVDGNTFGLPTCEWELSVPESSGARGVPVMAIVLLPENDYHSRVDPIMESLHDIDGPADEMKLHFVGGGDTDLPATVDLFVLDGDQGFHFLLGLEVWTDRAAATSALIDLTDKLMGRI